MADAEPLTNAEIVFRGNDGNECEAFVVAIRDLAFAKGKDEDSNWMLRYAATRLRHKALRWHAKLDPSIRKDWDLFVQALFEEYPLVEERDEGGIATPVWTSTAFSPPPPSTAALPVNDCFHTATHPGEEEGVDLGVVRPHRSGPLNGAPIPAPQFNYPLHPEYKTGRLRVVYEEGGTGPYYINRGQTASSSNQPDTIYVTTDIHEALIVVFTSSSESHQIGCMNSRQPYACNLGIQLSYNDLSQFHPLVGAKSVTALSTQNIPCNNLGYDIVSSIWTLLPDGTLRATLNDLKLVSSGFITAVVPSDAYSTTTAYVEIPGPTISFANETGSSPAFHPSSKRPIARARIVFEPI